MQDCVYQTPVRDATDLKQLLTDTWNGLSLSVVDDGGRDLELAGLA